MLALPEKNEPAEPAPVEEKRRTVTLTNARPLSILESEWPVIAEGGTGFGGDGCPYELTVSFRVRKGMYYRYLIHGKFNFWDESNEEASENIRVGKLFTSAENIESTLLAVGKQMHDRVRDEKLKKWVTLAVDACFAKLGPQVL